MQFILFFYLSYSAKWLARKGIEKILSPKQHRQPLPSLLYVSFLHTLTRSLKLYATAFTNIWQQLHILICFNCPASFMITSPRILKCFPVHRIQPILTILTILTLALYLPVHLTICYNAPKPGTLHTRVLYMLLSLALHTRVLYMLLSLALHTRVLYMLLSLAHCILEYCICS